MLRIKINYINLLVRVFCNIFEILMICDSFSSGMSPFPHDLFVGRMFVATQLMEYHRSLGPVLPGPFFAKKCLLASASRWLERHAD